MFHLEVLVGHFVAVALQSHPNASLVDYGTQTGIIASQDSERIVNLPLCGRKT